ncbi:cathepsin L.1 [Esox lucius]|uniref:cathepsin L.1 n=1 Tax=Esox lucius TaxID=8010 RepID=UPI0005763908|nr:cathepsin L.1 [Esox lucius]
MASENEDLDKEFEEWKIEHGKEYKSEEEEAKRKTIWLQSRNFVIEHNKKYDQGETTFTCGMNHMSDLEPHEICCGGRRKCHKEKTES